jgi:hypothetical protein
MLIRGRSLHYLTLGPNMKGGELFKEFFTLLEQGMPQQQAFIKVFGDFKTFNENWSHYVNRVSFEAGSIPPPPRLKSSPPRFCDHGMRNGTLPTRALFQLRTISWKQSSAERWYGPDHDEAVELWNAIPPAERPADFNLTAHVPEQNEQSATATVEATQCGDANRPFTLTIAKDGKTQSFYRKGNLMWGFSDTFWWGEDHLSLCHHLEGTRAIVYYQPGSDTSFAGELTRFDIRDN